MSLNAPQVFNARSPQDLPSFTTVLLTLPDAASCGSPVGNSTHRDGGLELQLNVQTGVAGLVFVELQDVSGDALPKRSLADVSPIRGNFFRKVVRWRGGTSLSDLAGSHVRMRVAMTDTKLYSATFTCGPA